MSGRILVVDDVKANVRLLEARLGAEYFEVRSAVSGADALEILADWPCDIVLLDVMMPGLDGFEVCRRIKTDPRLAHIPVVLITALDRSEDRIRGLRAGADEFLSKPVNDVALVARVRNLIGLKRLTDELRLRAQTGSQFGLASDFDPAGEAPGSVLIVDDSPVSAERLAAALSRDYDVAVEPSAAQALLSASNGAYDTILINLRLAGYDALRLVSQLRSLERTRLVPVVLIADPDDTARVTRALDLGVNDHVVRPIDKTELAIRVRTQVSRKRATDRLAADVEQTLAMAVTDPLSGLRNRRYLETHLASELRQAAEAGLPLALMLVDIDHFKRINDLHGHDAGDGVIRDVARRLRSHTRSLDLACRFGGEEFVMLMPETDLDKAAGIAERLRKIIEAEPFSLPSADEMLVTVSIGVAAFQGRGDSGPAMLKRADQALYRAKAEGRNRVELDAGESNAEGHASAAPLPGTTPGRTARIG
ncbi:PleD family two-component system response regulator [Stappia indica]|uniref:diguanylate cyclase n=1 Tax=Stappia indica TaxID=538381 RepID=A0A857C3Y9_9HYPH|nr:PleD family two-component system response regulator [Stappia indica]QGZ33673.1 PleD family two-component system response regulator [Stappia indica]